MVCITIFRVVIFLDKLEKKKTEIYTTFLDILADFDPHLYLMLTDEEFEGNPSGENKYNIIKLRAPTTLFFKKLLNCL